MKILQLSIVLLLLNFSFDINAQNLPEVGEKLVIGNSSNYGYADIKLPKANFILKKNGRLNYSQLEGEDVVVHKIRKKEDKTIVVLKKADNTKFFGTFSYIRADYEQALKSGELKNSK